MRQAALGFRIHSGWTALVAVSLEKGEPLVLVRQRAKLVQTFTYEFRQPYHTAEKLSLGQARPFVSRVETEAKELAKKTIRSVQTDLQRQGYELTCLGMPVGSAQPLPSLDKILSSHALIHTADGELFRAAVLEAGELRHLAAFTIRERELVPAACGILSLEEQELKTRLTTLGKLVGSPWSQDEKFASLAAWLALLPRSRPTFRT
jgi:hypothetical protein